MTGVREQGRRLIAASAVQSALKDVVTELRDQSTGDLVDLWETVGSDRLNLPEGTVALRMPSAGVNVTSEAELLAYVREHYPTEVIEVVRPAFREQLVKRLTVEGEQVVDKLTGDVVAWAKAVPAGDPTSIVVRPNDAAKATAAALINRQVLQIEGGDQ